MPFGRHLQPRSRKLRGEPGHVEAAAVVRDEHRDDIIRRAVPGYKVYESLGHLPGSAAGAHKGSPNSCLGDVAIE